MRTNRRTCPAAEIVPESVLAPLDFRKIFGRAAPLEVDLGCGDGSFLTGLAGQNPERNFLGIEQLPGRIRSAARKIGDRGLTNAKVLPAEILYAVRQFFAPESVHVFHLLFSDPWPKRRHHYRRVVSREFLRATARALVINGELRIATDHRDYFSAIRQIVAEQTWFAIDQSPSAAHPTTTFETRFREGGAEIHRLSLRKISPGRR